MRLLPAALASIVWLVTACDTNDRVASTPPPPGSASATPSMPATPTPVQPEFIRYPRCDTTAEPGRALRHSADGVPRQAVALTTDFRLIVIDTRSGQEVRELVDRSRFDRHTGRSGLDAFEVSPDGRILYFTEYGKRGPTRLCRLNLQTAIVESLGVGQAPSISPDGTHLAMSVKSFRAQRVSPLGALAVIDLASGATQVWNFPKDDPDFFQVFGSISDIAWSLDGSTIAYVSSYEGAETRLLRPAEDESLKDATLVPLSGDQPTFLPDGSLMFRRRCCFPDFDRDARIVLHDLSTAENSRYQAVSDPLTLDAAPTGHVLIVVGDIGIVHVVAPNGNVTRLQSGYLAAAW